MTDDRRWLELRVVSPGRDEPDDRLTEGLLALGGRAVEERPAGEGSGPSLLTHLPAPDEPLGDFLQRARALFHDLTEGEHVVLEHRWQRHEDWAESWKRGLGVRRLTPRLVVTPSWMSVEPKEGERVLVLDPGMAFGTAEHGTTRGCLRLLDRAEPEGRTVLDLGAGSGILSIAALLLGADSAVAVEGDELACEALLENLERNGVADRTRLLERWADPELLLELGPADIVMANIEWVKLRPMVDALMGAVASGGRLVVGGLLEPDLPELLAQTAGAGLEEEARDADGEWHSVLFRRPSDPSGAGSAPQPGSAGPSD